MAEHTPKYRVPYRQGRAAAREDLPENACPYGIAEIGDRMAWLGGWWDAMKEREGVV